MEMALEKEENSSYNLTDGMWKNILHSSLFP